MKTRNGSKKRDNEDTIESQQSPQQPIQQSSQQQQQNQQSQQQSLNNSALQSFQIPFSQNSNNNSNSQLLAIGGDTTTTITTTTTTTATTSQNNQSQQQVEIENENENLSLELSKSSNDKPKKKLKQDNQHEETTTEEITTNKYINIKWNEIDIEELDGLLYYDLKVIGKSLGISLNSISRVKLIDRIKYIIKFNIESIEKKKVQDNSNPFNKSTFNQLVITSDKQGQDELLFWKIFKNKAIFKKVMSFMNVYPNSVPYDYIVSVKEMLENNQISLFKDKVKTNKYLSFKDNTFTFQPFLHKPLINKIFSIIQDDKSFYQSLFSNYMDDLYNCIGNESLQVIGMILIKSNCLIGYQVLISNYNFIPLSDNLCFVIEHSKWEFFKFFKDSNICVPKEPLFNKEQTLSKNIKSVKEFLNLYKQQYSNSNSYDIIGFWFTDENVNPLNTRLKDLIKWIKLYELLDPQHQVFEQSKFKYPDYVNDIVQNETMSTPMDSLFNEIKSFKFSVEQLKSNVNDPINYSSNERNNIIKLLHVIFKVISSSIGGICFAYYYICYGEEIVDEVTNQNRYDNNGIICPKTALEYGNYLKFIKCLNDQRFTHQSGSSSIYSLHQNSISTEDKIASLYEDRYNFNKQTNILFSKCKDKETQINFINLAIHDIKVNDPKQFKLKPMLLFIMLVNFDDLELVKLFVGQLGKDHIRITGTGTNYFGSRFCFSNSITRYIKSIDMLDYIFNEFNHLITNNDLFENVRYTLNELNDLIHQDNFWGVVFNEDENLIRCQFTDFNLLKYFRSIYKGIGNGNRTQPLQLKLWYDIENPTVEIIEYVLTDSIHYGRIGELLSIKPIDFNDNQDRYFSILKHSIETTTTGIQFNPLSFFIRVPSISSLYPPKSFIKYLIWLNEYPFYQIEFSDQSKCKTVQYFITSEQDYQQILKQVTCNELLLQGFNDIIRYSIIRGDLITLSTILDCLLNAFDKLVSSISTDTKIEKSNLIQQDKIKNFILTKILNIVVSEDQFLVLEYLYFNYNRILKKKSSKSIKNNVTNDQDPIFNDSINILIGTRPYSPKINKLILSL